MFSYPVKYRGEVWPLPENERQAYPLTREVSELPSQFGLPERPLSNGVQFFQADGFDIEARLEGVKRPVIEIGGPTGSSYAALSSAKLAVKPIITGYYDQRESRSVDIIADGRALPFATQAIGAVLMSSIPYRDINNPKPGPLFPKYVTRAAYCSFSERIQRGRDPYRIPPELKDSPRLGAMLEASRVLVDLGLLIMRHTDNADLAILKGFGFQLAAHNQRITQTGKAEDALGRPPEFVFVLNKNAQ